MLLTISTVVILLVGAWFFSKPIHKYKWYLHGVILLAAILLFFYENTTQLGFIPLGVFLVVMYTGAIPKTTLRKRLMYVRSEFAIAGFLMVLPHGVKYFWQYLTIFGLDQTTTQTAFGSIAFMVMIPLFITSFQEIRRKMTYKTWKTIHRFAYVIYTAIYLHVLLLQNERFFIYLTLGIIYGVLKLTQLSQYVLKKRAS